MLTLVKAALLPELVYQRTIFFSLLLKLRLGGHMSDTPRKINPSNDAVTTGSMTNSRSS